MLVSQPIAIQITGDLVYRERVLGVHALSAMRIALCGVFGPEKMPNTGFPASSSCTILLTRFP